MTRKYIIYRMKPLITVIQFIGRYTSALITVGMLVALYLMLAGCTATDDVTGGDTGGDGKQGSAIAFSVSSDSTTRAITRTAPGTMTLDGTGSTVSLREKGFGVFACHTGVHPYVSTSTTANLFYNQLVSYNGGAGAWTYTPLVYWPSGEEDVPEYVSFFAYAPHSTNSNGCIVDMSRPEEVGDPWILYQLGGGTMADGDEGWKARQVDLVYDFKKDQKRTFPIAANKIEFDFKHALACIGDQVTVSVGESVKTRLKGIYFGTPVTLNVSTITIDYLLTRKGRLVLNNSSQPNWQAVESEDAKVHRILTYSPNLMMAQATSASACTTNSFTTGAGNGVFYIPLEAGPDKQKVTVKAQYTVTTGSPAYVIDEGTLEATVDLSYISNPSQGRNLNITIQIPEIECAGAALTSATVGQIICSHGKAYPATMSDLVCGGRKVAIVAYKGSDGGEDSPYNHGLAIALKDASASAVWCNQTAATCLPSQLPGLAAALNHKAGISATTTLAASADHQAAKLAAAYSYGEGISGGSHPDGTSQWFLPTMGQWNLMVKAMTEKAADLTQSDNDNYKAAAFNEKITVAGGTGVASAGLYWSSTESSASNAWYMSFKDGKTNSHAKTYTDYVRAIIAF